MRDLGKPKRILMVDDSAEGIFTGIYEAYQSRYGHDNIELKLKTEENYELEFFAEYIEVQTDAAASDKVLRSIREKAGGMVCEILLTAVYSQEMDRADVIYRYVIRAFVMGAAVIEHLSDPYVNRVLVMNQNIANEDQHLKGFLRFSSLDNGVLASIIAPKNNLLPHLAAHFTDRFPEEDFLIVDRNRKTAAMHRKHLPWILTDASEFDFAALERVTEEENTMRELWKAFFRTIAIKERTNKKLQRNMLPLRFRENMVEFQDKPGADGAAD